MPGNSGVVIYNVGGGGDGGGSGRHGNGYQKNKTLARRSLKQPPESVRDKDCVGFDLNLCQSS